MEEQSFKEGQRRRQKELHDIAAAAARDCRPCSKFRVSFDPCGVIAPVTIREVKQISTQFSNRSIDLHLLMNEIALPAASPPVV